MPNKQAAIRKQQFEFESGVNIQSIIMSQVSSCLYLIAGQQASALVAHKWHMRKSKRTLCVRVHASSSLVSFNFLYVHNCTLNESAGKLHMRICMQRVVYRS
jgi:hypothetical protein